MEWFEKKQRWVKRPYNARTGRYASSTDPATWSAFDLAWRVYFESKGQYSGVGFVLGDGWVGVDLDGCRNPATGALAPWAAGVLQKVSGYTEVSPSGTGVHLIGRGALPAGRRERDDPAAEHRGVAIYDVGRYFTITGLLLPDSTEITDITPQLAGLHRKLFRANGASASSNAAPEDALTRALRSDSKLRALWGGDVSGYPSQSEADLALCIKLVFWFGRDRSRVDQLFRQSALMRDKWDHGKYGDRTLDAAFERQMETRGDRPSRATAKPKAENKTAPPLSDSSLEDIYDSDYPEPAPIIDAILYSGLTLFAGRPKVGKSWLAMQLALSIVSGGKFADYLEVKKAGRCLYLALEERPRQTRSRIRQLTPPNDFLANARYIYEIPALMAGGAALLDNYLTGHPTEVVIVDSLLAITQQAGRKGLDLLQTDYNIIATLRQIAEKHAIAMIVVAHSRKAAGDFVDVIQGTSGTTAAADAIWVMARMPDGRVALSVTGREFESNVYGLERCGDSPAWKITGEGDEIQQSEARREIMDLLRENGPMKLLAIVRVTRKSTSSVHNLLSKLVQSGLIVKTHYGTYQVLGNSKAASV